MKLLIPFEWLLLTIQYRSFRAYSLYKKEQKRRSEQSEPPLDGAWVAKIKKFFWKYRHKYTTDYWPKEIVDAYYTLLHILAVKSEDLETDCFKFNTHTLRISGSTVVIDEKYALNVSGKGIYAHKRETPKADWGLVYRTNWLMKDTHFFKLLDTASRAECLLVPFVEEDSLNEAIPTTVN